MSNLTVASMGDLNASFTFDFEINKDPQPDVELEYVLTNKDDNDKETTGDAGTLSADQTAVPLDVTGLDSNTNYEMFVQHKYGGGQNSPSNTITFKTNEKKAAIDHMEVSHDIEPLPNEVNIEFRIE
jgi:hypothetical protein